MNFSILYKIKSDNLILKQISKRHKKFIADLFTDREINNYYIVPKEAQQDHNNLVNFWLTDMSNGAGYCWIIYAKSKKIFSSNIPIGFFAFEYRNNINNARISYALKSEFRYNSILTKCAILIFDELNKLGVVRIESDIDNKNLISQSFVKKLGFITNENSEIIDNEMLSDGKIRYRHLWYKEIINYNLLDFYVLKADKIDLFFNNSSVFKIWEEEIPIDNNYNFLTRHMYEMKWTGKYHFLIENDITESLVGKGNNSKSTYNVPWQLLREERIGTKSFIVFSGWCDLSGGDKFNLYEIGVEKEIIATIIGELMSNNPKFFSLDKMCNIIGLEGFKFINGRITI